MIQAKCIQKFRDKNNKIIGYRLIDLNKKTQDFTPEVLKKAIESKKIHVVNLTLTSDGRLMNTSDKVLPYEEKVKVNTPVRQTSKVKQPTPVKQTGSDNKTVDDLAKAFSLLEWSFLSMGDSFEDTVEGVCSYANVEFNPELSYTNDQLKGQLYKAYKVLVSRYDTYLVNRLTEILEDESEYYVDQIKDYIVSENVSKITDSKMYKAVYLIYKYIKDMNKKIAKQLKDKILDEMKTNGVASTRLGYYIGHSYFDYLDEEIFGTITNSYFTVGHILTTDEKREFSILKPYSYKCSKDFNLLSPRPEVGITFLFKNGEPGKVIVDIEMHRTGYVSEHCVQTVGYIKHLGSITLDTSNDDEENSKIVAGYCNKIGKQIKEFANKHQSLLHILPLGAEIENFR